MQGQGISRAYTKGQKRRRAKRIALAPPPIVEVTRVQSVTTKALDAIQPENLRWFVLLCGPRKEATAIRVFDLQGIPAAIPTQQKSRTRRGRLLKWREPVMPGYVLVGFPGEAPIPWYAVLRFKVITKIIGAKGEPAQVPWHTTYQDEGQIKRGGVQELLADLDATRIAAAKYIRLWERGQSVRINDGSGPFAGFEGKIMDVSATQVRVSLTLFGRETPVWVSIEAVERAA